MADFLQDGRACFLKAGKRKSVKHLGTGRLTHDIERSRIAAHFAKRVGRDDIPANPASAGSYMSDLADTGFIPHSEHLALFIPVERDYA